MTITLQDIPEDVERALQDRASRENKTVEQTTLEIVAKGLGVNSSQPLKKTCDLTGIAGLRTIDDEMEAVFESQRRIDPDIWK